MKKIYYISNALPNSFTGGSDFLAFNLLRKLKKKYKVYTIAIGSNYCKKKELKLIHNELKKNKINYFEIKENINYSKKPLSIFNFFDKNYINQENTEKAKKFISTINIQEKDILFAYGSASIIASSEIKSKKIALFEDIQNQVEIYRTFNSINKLNFIKKILRLILLKIHYRGYYNWLRDISSNHEIRYTFSPFDYRKLKSYFKLDILPVPMPEKIKKFQRKKNKPFNITMFSASISQDYNGVYLLFNKLIPFLIKKKIFDKVKINLIMRIPKNIPEGIKNILKSKFINTYRYNKNILKETDLLFYPSKYPVGLRSKILFAFSQSWMVATSSTVKKCIPELEDFKNCLMSNNINILAKKIIKIIERPKNYNYLIKDGYRVLKKYSVNNSFNKIDRDIRKYFDGK